MRNLRPVTSRNRGAAGFTLVEMLVTLALMGLVAVVTFGGLRFGARAWETGSGRAADAGEIEAVQTFLRRQMSRMLLPEDRSARASGAVLLGEARGFQFLSILPPELGVGGIGFFRIYLDTGADNGRLALDWALYRPDGLVVPPDAAERSRALLRGVRDIRIGYYGAVRDGEDPAWRDAWLAHDRLPSLVKLELAFAEGDRRIWPPLSVAPRLASSP
ncbi:prepilin-type N-terminal cleavage/methylation domain-containing protein (plasmid) [Skermanella mucosa]|uniref:prepilin-type N-terminal cleavage/methylation domain-containing protein n=1 Tax=Skermanella mucosa TaxID=1789672 RepID=UPI00192C6740|nr:prepilin-type N-terminal cleavage/methylation domain-containing protein [Skermanella mucosa]UEM24402.1 prepilin-type N-terminal cleavage/methylation domain-containing protein [Skermanella mucosa]